MSLLVASFVFMSFLFVYMLDGPGQTWVDLDRHRRTQKDMDRPRQTWGSHGFQAVLPDFGTNGCGIRIGGIESEDTRTFINGNFEEVNELE